MQNLKLFRLPERFRGRSAIVVQIWWFVQSALFKTSPQFMYGWRRWLLKIFGAQIGAGVLVRPSVTITYPWRLSIGDHSWIGDDVVLYSLGEISIGKNSVISQKSYLCAGSHDYSKEDFPIFADKIVVEDGCWIATDVFVAPGVTIGKYTVVGARSSVFGDLPSDKICFGNPAKVKKERFVDA